MSRGQAFFFSDDLSSSFVISDLALFAREYESVTVITQKQPALRPGLKNVEVVVINDAGYSTAKILLGNFFRIIVIAFRESFSYPVYLLHPRFFIGSLSGLLRCFYKAQLVEKELVKAQQAGPVAMIYTFWFNDWATVLGILKRKKIITHFYTRAHGADLFEERALYGKLPLRHFQLREAARVFSVSEKGSRYLKQKYPAYASKIFTSYLGTADAGINTLTDNHIFTMVSCAKIRDIKRIYLLAEILKYVPFPLRWIHLGGENAGDPTLPLLHKTLVELKQKHPHIEVQFAGDLDNRQVLEFYTITPVNLFVSVSETEGLPVSMMEAISFGIPVLATDVGGCGEIVTPQTGLLIKTDIQSVEAAAVIGRFRDSAMNTVEFRKGVKAFWKNNFNAEVNFARFLELAS